MIIFGGQPEDWGIIPTFLDEDDPRSAKEQFNAKYISGWNRFEGFALDRKAGTLSYPDDPPYRLISVMIFRRERILLFPSAWVVVMQPDGSWEVSRMD